MRLETFSVQNKIANKKKKNKQKDYQARTNLHIKTL